MRIKSVLALLKLIFIITNTKLMKLKTSIFILFITLTSNAQDIINWQIGFNLNPFFFTRISTQTYFIKDKQDVPNGFGYGLTLEKNWNTHWGIKTGFESTKQNEKYYANEISADDTRTTLTLEYYKIPLTIQYYYPIQEKLFLTFNQGIQLSSLKYYKTVLAGNFQKQTYSSNYNEFISYQFPESTSLTYGDFEEYLHKKYLFGILGSIGLKGFLTNRNSYSTNLRYEYDLTSADLIKYFSRIPFDKEKPITNNFRLGLELGLQYNFSLGGCKTCGP
jgi:hypothetical protein